MDLYDDIILVLFKHVDIGTLYNLFVTNKKFNSFSRNKELWHHQYNVLNITFEIDVPEYYDKCKTYKTLCILKKELKYKYVLEHLYRSDYLSRCYNIFITIPKSITILQQLKTIYLDGNNITQFPEALLTLANLEELSLAINKIKTIPKNIYKLRQLRTLKLFNNQISELPQQLSKMKNLKNLYLFKNRISKVPDVLSSIKNIEFISLESNFITEIPEKILHVKTLKKLILKNNPICQVPNLSNTNLRVIL
jgi:hypothetical protein